MITLKRVRLESRRRDGKRNRLLLSIGSEYHFHVTPRELTSLVRKALRYKDVKELLSVHLVPKL